MSQAAVYVGLAALILAIAVFFILVCINPPHYSHDQKWMRDLNRRFPDWGTSAALKRWPEEKEKLSIGQEVSGEVIADMESGIWLDIGLSFPALMHFFDRLNYRDGKPCSRFVPPIGAIVECRIKQFENGQIWVDRPDNSAY